MTAALQIHTIVSMPFEENTYVVWRPDRHDALETALHLPVVGDIDDLRRRGRESGRLRVELVQREIPHRHAAAFGSEPLRDAEPDAPRAAGDDRALPCQ